MKSFTEPTSIENLKISDEFKIADEFIYLGATTSYLYNNFKGRRGIA